MSRELDRPDITLSELEHRAMEAATELASVTLGIDRLGDHAEPHFERGEELPAIIAAHLSEEERGRFEALRERLITNLTDLMFANFHVVPDDPDQGAIVRDHRERISPAGRQSGFGGIGAAQQAAVGKPVLGHG